MRLALISLMTTSQNDRPVHPTHISSSRAPHPEPFFYRRALSPKAEGSKADCVGRVGCDRSQARQPSVLHRRYENLRCGVSSFLGSKRAPELERFQPFL